jgi:hypothetical protein
MDEKDNGLIEHETGLFSEKPVDAWGLNKDH